MAKPMVGVRVKEELKELMDRFPETNWSAVVREKIRGELKKKLAEETEWSTIFKEKPIPERREELEKQVRQMVFSKDFTEELTNALTPKVEARIKEGKEEVARKKLEEV